ncbi:hypothetical protein KR767_06620 [Luteibacter anthropi]|uniref:hypothetical protein n=1 Tax=Luteibacter anthropi TaxID=564369 RepID=UPI00203249C2|nr:hypothetical protein [Luteibacter anthropi]URX63722.1 hypothetical protein KR767_06620 [Luteibacter anthropi]
MSEILLRFCEGAAVVLYRRYPKGRAENVPARVDLYTYAGGYAWGYGGSGPNALSHAIAGKIFEFVPLTPSELSVRARIILEGLVIRLDGASEHTLDYSVFSNLFPGEMLDIDSMPCNE